VRKIILPLVICLALVASVSAGTYKAYVTMKIDPVVGPTSVAELAFAPGSGTVSADFVKTDPGNSMQVIMHFGKVQPNSKYYYEETLKVTNNKPYTVQLKVSNVSGTITNLDNFEIWHGGCGLNPWANFYMSKYGGVVNTGSCTITLPANTSDYISFMLSTDYDDPAGTYNGTVTFYAWVWQAP
jgi:hypothetical protein